MKIPKKLKIGGHWVTVELTDQLPEDIDGEYDNTYPRIRLNKRLPQSMLEVSLFHEILHSLNGTFDSEAFAHSLLDSMAEQLYQVFSDNHFLR